MDSAESVERTLQGEGIQADHLRYACSAIANQDHAGLTMDAAGWRAHSIVTHTTKKVRPYYRLGGEVLTELDVSNAQPLLLAAAMKNPDRCATYVADAQHNGVGRPAVVVLDLLRGVPEQEIRNFAAVCANGLFYEALMERTGQSREQTKTAACRDPIFGKLNQHGRVTRAFTELWPGIDGAIRAMKGALGHAIMSRLLQRLESVVHD